MSRTPPTSPRPRAEHLGPVARRPLVLDAALAVWAEHGYRGTTMAAVAAAAGVSKPVVYECFGSKDEVLLALLDREERRLLATAMTALPRTAADLDRQLAGAYEAFFRAVLEHPLSWRVLFEAPRDAASPIGGRYRRGRAAVVDQVASLLASTDLAMAGAGADERLVVAEHCVTLAEDNAWRLVRGGPQGPWDPASLAALVARLVLRGIG